MGLDLTSFDAALKEYYTDDVVQDMVYKKNPLLALMPKMEEFYGKSLPVPIIYGNPQGRSGSFARAQARSSTTTLLKDFNLTRNHDYGIATIDNETLEASKNDKGAFLDAATTEIDGIINSLTRSLATAMYGTGFGGIGVVGSFATTTITLSSIESVTNFEVGMELTVAAAEGSGNTKAYGSSGNGLIITGVNRVTGVLTFGFNVDDATNGIPLIANADTIFVRGDRIESGTISFSKIVGLKGWVPESAPSSTAFFGVDRTADVTRLGGVRFDGSALPIEEALIEGAALCAREGGAPDYCFMSTGKFADLEKALGSKVQYVDLKVGGIGFRGINIHGQNGDIKVLGDMNCPENSAWMLQMDVWKLYSLGKSVRVIDTDGLKMLRQATADGVEVRYGYYAQMGCRAPGFNLNLKLG